MRVKKLFLSTIVFILLMKILLMRFIQITLNIISIFFVLTILHSCDEPVEDDSKDFQQNLNSFNNTIDELDNTLDLMDSMQQKINDIEEQRALGKISDEDAILKLNHINNTLGRQIAQTSSTGSIVGIPVWAKQLGLTEPANMSFDRDYSQSTSENNNSEGFNSIILVYKGNYEEAIKQAGIIAQKANIPMSQDYKDALILSKEYDIETIKGASYMNFEFGSDNNPRYNISITVDDNGTLTINATDTYALMKQLQE